jgi:erythromycin esterase-like protein
MANLTRQRRHKSDRRKAPEIDVASLVRAAAEPLPDFDDPAFGAMFDRVADARVVLLGEASHGTSEFYRARAAITRRLIERERYGCLTPWQNEPQGYGRMALTSGYAKCEGHVVNMLHDLLQKELDYRARNSEGFLDAVGNARLVRDAEAYYRAMYFGSAESWNLRDRHMFATLDHLLEFKGASAKAVVWAHNSHIGDAAFTEMGQVHEEINIGQLCREKYGAAAMLIGFGTHTGTVAAATDWDDPMEVKRVVPSRPDSYERIAHDAGLPRFLLDLRDGQNDEARSALMDERLERFIGVIYRPETERQSHYTSAQLARQFDAYVWFDETRAVTPLPTEPQPGEDETYPFGL